MMIAASMPMHELTASAIRLLCREMGVINTIRFINQFTTGQGDYTHDRDHLFGAMTVEQIESEIERQR
jgi:hypothetical protein